MGRTTPLRREIKRIFIPHLTEKGFAVDMRHAPQFCTFRRIGPDAVQVCDIQWDKYGRPRFVVNFGVCGPEEVMFRGERIPPEDIFPFHATDRGRLAPSHPMTAGWYRQDRPLLAQFVSLSRLYSPEAVVAKLMMHFVEVEDYWASRRIGPHVRLLPKMPLRARQCT